MENTNNTIPATEDSNKSFNVNASYTSKKTWTIWKSMTIILAVTSLCGISLFIASLTWKKESETNLNSQILQLQSAKAEQAEKCASQTLDTPEEKPIEEVQDTPSFTPDPVTPTTPTPDVNQGYLVIKEWNVKIKMRDADKITYMYWKYDNQNTMPIFYGAGKYDSQISPVLINKINGCTNEAGATIVRMLSGNISSLPASFPSDAYRKIGERIFATGGNLGDVSTECSYQEYLALMIRINEDFAPKNMEQL